jgi:para-nitrobenzyl esterase
MVDGRIVPAHPWDPAAPEVSARIPLLIGSTHTEETLYDRPTPDKLALNEDGLRGRVAKRLGIDDPGGVIAAYHKDNPEATPWDLYILIATDHPRHLFTRTGEAQSRAGRSAGLFLSVRLGDAGRRRPHAFAARGRSSVRF